jgi:hypothetical protein
MGLLRNGFNLRMETCDIVVRLRRRIDISNIWNKSQLDATEYFIASLLSAQHVSGIIMPIIRSSRLYRLLLHVVHNTLVYRSLVWWTTCRNHLYNLELLMMGIIVPETCWADNTLAINYSVASNWLLFHIFHNDAGSNSHQVYYEFCLRMGLGRKKFSIWDWTNILV